MSLKKFMHPKNKYKVDPDFKQLALIDPNFQKVAITLLNGKVSINFKDENSLITLTKTLLKHDFNLDVNIPPMKLVPALPLRLNYVLWIEDILNYGQFLNDEVHGIDIGVGAVCIYPLLIAQEHKWKMTGTEIDSASCQCAIDNVKRNKLEHLIDVELVNRDTILKEVIKEKNFTFVMCNPPFFKTDDMTKMKKNPPRNASTGCERELFVEGGEQKFISRLIDDSIELKDRVKIYTTMFGKKNTLSIVKRELADKNITNTTWTEFCQGYTKRWGLAWTFLPEEIINLKKAPVIRTKSMSSKKSKDSNCMISFSDTSEISSLEDLNDIFIKSVIELKIKSKEMDLECNDCDCYAYDLIAYEDSWSHARRKRRMAMRSEASSDAKKPCLENIESLDQLEITESEDVKENEERNVYLKCNVLIQEITSGDNEELNEEKNEEQEKNPKSRFCVRFIYESGDGGKQAIETMRQYFINKFNVREHVTRSNPQKKTKKKKKK